MLMITGNRAEQVEGLIYSRRKGFVFYSQHLLVSGRFRAEDPQRKGRLTEEESSQCRGTATLVGKPWWLEWSVLDHIRVGVGSSTWSHHGRLGSTYNRTETEER